MALNVHTNKKSNAQQSSWKWEWNSVKAKGKKLIVALPGMLPHNQELHGFQLYLLFYKSARSLLIVYFFFLSKPNFFFLQLLRPPHSWYSFHFLLFSPHDTQLTLLFLLLIQASTSSTAYPLLHYFLFRKCLHFNHHHGKVAVSLVMRPL